MPSYSSFPGFVIRSTTIAVDFWPKQNNANITHYFLTHAHKDHTRNLDASWTGPAFYCSNISKKLIKEINEVADEYAIGLDIGMTHIMNLGEEETFNVTLMDANHCPGAVMYLFEGYFGHILATGDFRYCPEMFVDTPLSTKQIDICYLDNTYFNKQFSNIPSRSTASQEIIGLICVKREQLQNVVFHINLRILGKETLLTELYDHFKIPILVSKQRYERLVNIIELSPECFTTECQENTLIFVADNNEETPNFGEHKVIIYIEPSALNIPHSDRSKTSNIDELYADPKDRFFIVPYTDHSSYDEIVEFVRKLKPKQIVPIVRKPLPGNIEIADLSELNVYLSSEPVFDCHDKYRTILRNTAVLRRTSRRNSKKLPVKTNNHNNVIKIIRKTKTFKKIQYESQSSQSQDENENFENKTTKKELNEKRKSDKMTVIKEEGETNNISTPNNNILPINADNNQNNSISTSDQQNTNNNHIIIRRSSRLSMNKKSNDAIERKNKLAVQDLKWKKVSDQVDVFEASDSKSSSSIFRKVEEKFDDQDTEDDAETLSSAQINDNPAKANSKTTSTTNINTGTDDDFTTPMTSPARIDCDENDKNDGRETPNTEKKEKSANSIILDHTLSDRIDAQKGDNDENQNQPTNGNTLAKKVIPRTARIPLNEFFNLKPNEEENRKFCEAIEKSLRKSGDMIGENQLTKNLIQNVFESFTF